MYARIALSISSTSSLVSSFAPLKLGIGARPPRCEPIELRSRPVFSPMSACAVVFVCPSAAGSAAGSAASSAAGSAASSAAGSAASSAAGSAASSAAGLLSVADPDDPPQPASIDAASVAERKIPINFFIISSCLNYTDTSAANDTHSLIMTETTNKYELDSCIKTLYMNLTIIVYKI